jgi:hypothetical protein
MTQEKNIIFYASSARIGYLILNIPTIILMIIYALVLLKHESVDPSVYGAVGIIFLYGLAWVVWLKGFKIIIDNIKFQYRDGLHRSHSVLLSDIKKTEFKWVDWRILTRVIKIPRLIIHSRQGGKPIWINIKPFAKEDLKELREILDEFPLS